MAQVNNNPIPDYETSWEGYSGASIENFIKQKLGFTPVYYNDGYYYKSYFNNESYDIDSVKNYTKSSSCSFSATLKNKKSYILTPGTLLSVKTSNNETITNSFRKKLGTEEINGIDYNIYEGTFDETPDNLSITIKLNKKV